MSPSYMGVISTVKKTLQKMTFPEGDVGRNCLVTMNVPALLARRDASFDTAVRLLRGLLFSYAEEKRCDIYKSSLKLLNVSIEATRLICAPGKNAPDEDSDAVLLYLKLLRDTAMAVFSLVRHEMILFEEEGKLAAFLGAGISTQFRSTDEIFSNSEVNVYHCLCDLVDFAEPTVLQYREYWKKSFSKPDLNRYKKAFAEFKELYAKEAIRIEASDANATPGSLDDSQK